MNHLPLVLTLFAILLQTGCDRNYVNGRLITSYSVETTSGTGRESLVKDLELFLAKSGMKKTGTGKNPGFGSAGFHVKGETSEYWISASEDFTLSVDLNPNEKFLSGNIGWNFEGNRDDWPKIEADIVRFQKELVDWFKARPDVVHNKASYWDGKL